MKILVQQYKHDDYLNVRLYKGSNVKTEENLELPEAYMLIEEYRDKYNINNIEFVLYDGVYSDDGEEIYRRTVKV